MLKHAHRVRETTTATNMATIALGGAVAGARTFAKAITAGKLAVGDTVPVTIEDTSGNWEDAYYTITSPTVLTRVGTGPIDSSNDGAAVTTWSGTRNVFIASAADWLSKVLSTDDGTSLSDYLAANTASTPANADLMAITQNGNTKGVSLSALASAVNRLWPSVAENFVQVNSTAAFPLDFTVHHRRRLLCSAAATINAPSQYSTVGDGFRCNVTNISGGTVTLGAGITGLPSGSSIGNGQSAEIFAQNGSIYAVLPSSTSGGGTTAPGQVIGLTAGTATSTTVPLSWTAVATATAYTVQYRTSGATQWTTFETGVSATSDTVTGLTAATAYEFQVIAYNSGGNGTPSATVSKSTAAASGGAAPFAVAGLATGFPFPTTMKTYTGDYWGQSVTATGAPTIVSVSSAISESSTVPPTSGISTSGAVGTRGVWFGAVTNYNNTGNWLLTGVPGIQMSAPSPINMYFWTFITDSNGVTWKFVSPVISIGDSVTVVRASSPFNFTQVP